MLDEILDIIVEIMSSQSSTIRVNREEKPAQVVKALTGNWIWEVYYMCWIL